jgi:hypothetical protein
MASAVGLRLAGPSERCPHGEPAPAAALPRLGAMNKDLDARGRYDAVMAADGLFQVEPAQ